MSYSLETVTSRLDNKNTKYFISNHLLSSKNITLRVEQSNGIKEEKRVSHRN